MDLEAVAERARPPTGSPTVSDDDTMHTLLDLARDAAHEVERPAAPLTTFLVGVAVGRGATLGAAAGTAIGAAPYAPSRRSEQPGNAPATAPVTGRALTWGRAPLWVRWARLVVFVVVLGTVFVNLGEWQLDRLDQRRERNATTLTNETGPVRPRPRSSPGRSPSRPVAAGRGAGTFDAEHQFVVRYRQQRRRDGYEVVTPLRTAAGVVLVDRGFVGPRRQPDPAARRRRPPAR